MEKITLRKADLVTSIILMFFSVCGFIMSLQLLLRTIGKGRPWFESAGLFPMIVTFLLFLSAISLFFTARKAGAKFDFFTLDKVNLLVKSREFKVASVIIGMLGVYIFILMLPGRMYEAVTFIYLFIGMVLFQKKSKKSIIISLLVAAIATACIAYGFGKLAMIPLP